jgi:hypothetical protein
MPRRCHRRRPTVVWSFHWADMSDDEDDQPAWDRARRRWERDNTGSPPEVAAYWLARIRAQLRGDPVPDDDPPPGQLSMDDG